MAASRWRLAGVRGAAVAAMLGASIAGLAPRAAAQDNVDGNVYTSPTYGYELEWDEDVWEVDEETSNRRDSLVLIETDASTWIALATGRTTWSEATHAGLVSASGERTDLTPYLPLG